MKDYSILQGHEKCVFDLWINSLNERLSCIFKMRLGVEQKRHTLKEIGSFYGISGERVAQIINKEVRRCRFGTIQSPRSAPINPYLEWFMERK